MGLQGFPDLPDPLKKGGQRGRVKGVAGSCGVGRPGHPVAVGQAACVRHVRSAVGIKGDYTKHDHFLAKITRLG